MIIVRVFASAICLLTEEAEFADLAVCFSLYIIIATPSRRQPQLRVVTVASRWSIRSLFALLEFLEVVAPGSCSQDFPLAVLQVLS